MNKREKYRLCRISGSSLCQHFKSRLGLIAALGADKETLTPAKPTHARVAIDTLRESRYKDF